MTAPEKEQATVSQAAVTELLMQWREGDLGALDRLTPIVYEQLRRLARGQMRREGGASVLQTTALVHEAYLRLTGQKVDWESRGHFFAIAAKVMRRVLVDEARRRHSQKRGGDVERVPLTEAGEQLGLQPDADLLALDEALNRLASTDERKAKIIELRFFAGLTIEETGRLLELSHATVERDFRVAKAWLGQSLRA